jgi:hypothetical protein
MVDQLTEVDGVLEYMEDNATNYETDDATLPDWSGITEYINIFGL